MEWQIIPNSIQNIVINGTETGDISGTVERMSTSPSFFANAANSIVDAGIKVGSSAISDSTNVLNFLPKAIKGAVINAFSNGVGGVVKGFLSGILGSNTSTSEQKVKLKINSQLSFSGNATTTSQLYDNIFAIPGALGVENTIPFFPNYQYPLGVFFLSNRPLVDVERSSTLVDDENGRNYLVQDIYSVNEESFDVTINPALLSIASITNIKKEVVVMDLPTNIYGLQSIYGINENVAGNTVYTGHSIEISRLVPRPTPLTPKVGVRVSFDVVPNDGGSKTTIVKTFLAGRS